LPFIILGCLKSGDIATTITLAKAKVGEYHEVQKQIQSLVQNPSAQSRLAELKIKRNSLLSDARNMLEQVNIRNTDIQEGIFVYLDVLELQGDYDLSAEVLEDIVKKHPENGDLWVRLGFNNMKKGENWLKPAFQCFQMAIRKKVSDKEAVRMWRCLGDIYWELHLLESAEESYQKAVAKHSDLWSKVGLSGIDVARGNMSDAEKKLTELGKELQPYDVPVRLRMRESLKIFEETNKNIKDSFDEYMAYSHILYRAGRIEDAIATGTHALFLNDKYWEGWNFLGSIFLQMGYLKDAERALSMSLQQNPDQPNIKKVVDEIINMKQKGMEKTSPPLIFRND